MNKSGKLKKSKPMYLLSSKIFCGECGCKLYGSIRYRSSAEPFHVYVCPTRKNQCSNLKEIDKISLEHYAVSLVRKYCNINDDFINAPYDTPPFRCELQKYIHSIVVNEKTVFFKLYVGEKVKTFRHGRKDFKTPTQRYFKSK